MSEIELNPIVRRFAERSPLPVMARAILERCLGAQQLNEWFEQQTQKQYTRQLLFSSVYELMTQVVLGQQPTVHAAVRGAGEAITVSVTSVYNKLNGLEVGTSAALVEWSACQAGELIQALEAAKPALLPGLTIKVLDGNVLDGREHRLKESRGRTAAPLPGKLVAVFDPQCEVIEAIVPSEDAYTQERALLPEVLSRHVGPAQLWLADRNFCTTAFLAGLVQRQAHALIREHGQLRYTPLEPMREIGLSEGAQVGEQWVQLGAADEAGTALKVRRIRLRLAQPTRDGDDTLCLLTTLGSEHADALTLAKLYRQRWTIERAFLHLTTQLRCEVDTLSYPPAALFALACAVVAFNVLAVIKAALRAAHGPEVDHALSSNAMASDLRNMAQSMDLIVDEQDWDVFRYASLVAMAAWLLQQAQRVSLKRYAKAPARKKPPTPAVKRAHDPKKPHVALSRLLAKEKAGSP